MEGVFLDVKLLNFILYAYSFSRLRRQLPRGGSLSISRAFSYRSIINLLSEYRLTRVSSEKSRTKNKKDVLSPMGRKTSSAVPPILTLKKVLLKRRDVTLRASLITQRAFFCKLGSVFHTRTMLPSHQAESSLKTPNRATRSVIAVIFKYKGIILH